MKNFLKNLSLAVLLILSLGILYFRLTGAVATQFSSVFVVFLLIANATWILLNARPDFLKK
jgi:hypothetical protein